MGRILLHNKIAIKVFDKKKGYAFNQLYPDVERIVGGIQSIYEEKGYKFYDDGAYNLNLGAVRFNRRITNRFDDRAWAIYKDDTGHWMVDAFNITTDSGFYYIKDPLHIDGCAILPPGQWKGLWKLGKHKGHDALVQNADCVVFRDNNHDNVIDYTKPQTGIFGINGHRAADQKILAEIGPYSAGCQVWESPWEFRYLLDLCRRSAEIYCSDIFTYTLLEAEDFTVDYKGSVWNV